MIGRSRSVGPGDDRPQKIGVEVGLDLLHHRGDALQAHPGVDARSGQRGEGAVGGAVELHEDEVPDLEIAVAVAPHGALRAPAAVGGTAVEDDLGAGAAGPGVAHGPEVVLFPEAHDALLGEPDLPPPDVVGLLVVEVDRGVQPLRGKPEASGEEVPRVLHGPLLEVVAEGEVAEHFEEGVVTRRVAHVFEVVVLAPGPHALLGAHRPRVVALFLSQEDPLELDHAGVDEQQRRVVLGDERGAAHHLVAALAEVVEETPADLVAGHGVTPPGGRRGISTSGPGPPAPWP